MMKTKTKMKMKMKVVTNTTTHRFVSFHEVVAGWLALVDWLME